MALQPDVLIVPEAEQLSGLPLALGSSSPTSLQWFGSYPPKGLAVLSYGDYAVEPHPSYDPSHQWIVPLIVSGPVSFLLFAVWAMPHATSKSYVHPLFDAFEHYKALIATSEVVWAGDFNANFGLDKPRSRHKFCDFVSLLGSHGIRSLYHEHTGCEHGAEPEDTFHMYHRRERGFHLDYIFASSGFRPCTFSLNIGSHAEWGQQSDHMPLLCEFHEPPQFGRVVAVSMGETQSGG